MQQIINAIFSSFTESRGWKWFQNKAENKEVAGTQYCIMKRKQDLESDWPGFQLFLLSLSSFVC